MPPAFHVKRSVSLQPVTRENVRAICDLQLAESQRHLVAPAAFTVAEGNYDRRRCCARSTWTRGP
jgi:hypothetical protein